MNPDTLCAWDVDLVLKVSVARSPSEALLLEQISQHPVRHHLPGWGLVG